MHIKALSYQDYDTTYQAMQAFTAERTAKTDDEIWLVEHPPVFTLGRHSDKSHILGQSDIPFTQTDRGGQVTYHGPGQLVIYTLIDLKRRKIGPKALVCAIEQATIKLLSEYDIEANNQKDNPGIYVKGRKIASLGLRVKQGKSYHGLALNVDMDLKPFLLINPCGIQNLAMTQISEETNLPVAPPLSTLSRQWIQHFQERLDEQSH